MSDAPRDTPKPGSLLVIFLTVFVDLLGFGIVLPLLPIYARDFDQGVAGWQIGVVLASFSVMQFFFAPIWGRISDRIGRRPVIMIGLAGSVVFYALFGVATVMKSFTFLLVTRIGAGIAGATIPIAQAYIADTTSVEKRSKGMALIGMAFGIGFTFGPLLGYLAVPTGSGDPGPWPGYVAAILSGIALLLAIFLLPESRHAESESAARKWLDGAAFKEAIATPSVGLILISIFVCVFSFANFETTISMLIKGNEKLAEHPFHFSYQQVCLTFAFIGFVLALVQGGIVRRLAGKVSEAKLAVTGALLEAAGFGMIILAIKQTSVGILFGALAIVVTGFSFMQPNLNGLLSRRSDPNKQGSILGVGQSMSSLARIFGALAGVTLLGKSLLLPYAIAAGLMLLGAVLVATAAKRGKDYEPAGDAKDTGK